MGILRANKKSEDKQEKELINKPIRRLRRKETPRPWGKKERYLILAILLVSISTSSLLTLYSRSWKLPGFPRLKFPSFNFPFLGEETFVIESDKEKLAQQEDSEEVIKRFKEETGKLSGVYGLYVRNLETGYIYGVNEKEMFEPASLNKLTVMAALYVEEESRWVGGAPGPEGEPYLETKYVLKNSDKLDGPGSLSEQSEGYKITYRNLIRLMGNQSDNTAFKIAKEILGSEKIVQTVLKIGMKNTSIEENETTPEDIGIFFEELWYSRLPVPEPARSRYSVSGGRSDGGQGNIVSKESAEELLDYLTDTDYEAWLTDGVPANIRVAHKYGRETRVVNDAGIVYAKEPYVIVILSKGVVGSEANSVFPVLSNIVYQGN